MKYIVHLIVACALVLCATPSRPAYAADAFTVTFEAIDTVELRNTSVTLEIDGLVQGETQPRTVALGFTQSVARERCERLALMVIAKPGRFSLQFGGFDRVNIFTCKLIRR